jgi:pimeloyl-ACP methyl ester carboxylesterase
VEFDHSLFAQEHRMNFVRPFDRRSALGAGLATLAATAAGCAQNGATPGGAAAAGAARDRRTFVLVHGALLGGWCWSRVSDRLQRLGHRVYAPTLTGLGERRHLLTREVTLATHIDDVLNLIDSEGLTDVTLVGHSFAGIITTAVADRLGRAKIRNLVYVDALVPTDGMAWRDFHAQANRDGFMKNVNDLGGGWKLMPAPGVTHLGVTDPGDTKWLLDKQTPHPASTYTAAVALLRGGYAPFARTYIDCTEPVLVTINSTKERVRKESGWQIVTMKTGHLPMVTQPEALTDILLRS